MVGFGVLRGHQHHALTSFQRQACKVGHQESAVATQRVRDEKQSIGSDRFVWFQAQRRRQHGPVLAVSTSLRCTCVQAEPPTTFSRGSFQSVPTIPIAPPQADRWAFPGATKHRLRTRGDPRHVGKDRVVTDRSHKDACSTRRGPRWRRMETLMPRVGSNKSTSIDETRSHPASKADTRSDGILRVPWTMMTVLLRGMGRSRSSWMGGSSVQLRLYDREHTSIPR